MPDDGAIIKMILNKLFEQDAIIFSRRFLEIGDNRQHNMKLLEED